MVMTGSRLPTAPWHMALCPAAEPASGLTGTWLAARPEVFEAFFLTLPRGLLTSRREGKRKTSRAFRDAAQASLGQGHKALFCRHAN